MASPFAKMQQMQELARLMRNIEEKFRCHICLDLLKHPVKLKCEHTFCRMCIETYIRVGVTDQNLGNAERQNSNCPLCQGHKNITKRSLEDDNESSPLRGKTVSFIRAVEDILDVDFKSIRNPPSSSKEASTPAKPARKPDFDFKVPTTRARATRPQSKARKKIVNDEQTDGVGK